MSVPNDASRNVLLLAKNWYGPYHGHTLIGILTLLANDAYCLELRPETLTVNLEWGRSATIPESYDTRQAILTMVVKAVRDYRGDYPIDSVLIPAMLMIDGGTYYTAIESLLGVLSTSSVSELLHPIENPPQIDSALLQRIKQVRVTHERAVLEANSTMRPFDNP